MTKNQTPPWQEPVRGFYGDPGQFLRSLIEGVSLPPPIGYFCGLRVFAIGVPGIVLLLHATCAFASREGEALVQPVLWIIWTVLATFVTLVVGGTFLGAFRARQSGESILKGCARGLLKGFVTFVVVAAVSVGTLTVVGVLWVAYSFLYVHVLS